ncbi:outer membrane protein [Paracoccus cavernae]|uniref:outer membrane protein n=1 Tax=Paracoccus cavernae TaxID=1571207 RepID=UPI0035F4A940
MSNRGQILKTLALSAPLALAGGFAANAGGYIAPIVEAEVAPIVEVTPAGDWAGAYAGVTLGYAFSGEDRVGLENPTIAGDQHNYGKLDLSGANAGVRVGYRWQKDKWVFGPELGYEAGNIEDSVSEGGYESHSKIKDVVALRFVTGYSVRPDMLVYGVAGVARGKVEYSVTGDGANGPSDIEDTFNRTGYIVGLGVEKKLTDRVSLTGQYEYANFGKETLTSSTGLDTEATAKYNNVKVGLNFRF